MVRTPSQAGSAPSNPLAGSRTPKTKKNIRRFSARWVKFPRKTVHYITSHVFQATWPQGRPDLEPVSVDRCTPTFVEGEPQPSPLLAAGYRTGQVEIYR